MKTLMLGNEAVARGLYEAGCSFVSSYPGTPSTEITEGCGQISGNLCRVGAPMKRWPWSLPSGPAWPDNAASAA